MTIDRPWLAQYPKGVPATIDVDEFPSIPSVLEGAIRNFRDRPAFTNLGKTISYAEVDDLSRKFAAYLLGELKRLQREKNDLERQFNDIAMLRDQVRKLRDELSISRRLDWIRRGLYGSLKGAERLQKSPTTPTTNRFDLNVELKESGTVNVTPLPEPPPAPATTNAPPPQ